MQPPTVYLIKRGLTEDKIEKLRAVLSLTPIEAIIVTARNDADYARHLDLTVEVVNLARPIAIIGDFEDDCVALGEGKPCPLL
jgi:hypothetical protein